MISFCCLSSVQNNQKVESKPKRLTHSLLKAGSLAHTNSFSRKSQIFFQLNFLGSYMPYYKNEKALELWNQIIKQINSEEEPETYETSRLINKSSSQSTIAYYQKIFQCPFIQNQQDIQIVKILQQTDEKFLRFLLIIGPPSKYRWSTWKTLLLLEKNIPYGVYERMIEKESPSHANIMKDVDRTLITHKLFSQEGQDSQIGQQYLGRILDAVANTVPKIGYCQGMNFLTGLLLIVSAFDEKKIYECLMSLLLSPSHMLYFLYVSPIPLYDILVVIIHNKIHKFFPELSTNLKKFSIPDSIWISKMIMTLFLYNFELSDSLRVWDYIISRGAIRAIPEIVLGIIECLKEQISECRLEKFSVLFSSFSEGIKLQIGDVLFYAKERFEILKKDIVEILKQYKPPSESHMALIQVLLKIQSKNEYETAAAELMKSAFVLEL